jgi:hypothetical protein
MLYVCIHTHTHTHTQESVCRCEIYARAHACKHAQMRGGGLTELDMSGKEGLPVAVVVAGLLERSAATLTSLDLR